MPTLDELLTGLREHVAGDADKAKELANRLHADLSPVAQVLIDKGAGKGKGEVAGKLKAAEAERDEARRERDELRAEFDDFKTKTPDAKTLEERVEAKWKPKVTRAEQERDAAKGTLAQKLRDLAVKDFVAALKPGVEVHDEYANEVLAAKYADRFQVSEDGTVRVLQPGKADAYDPADGQSAVSLLAADVRKTVPSWAVLSNAESGGGITNGGGGGAVQAKSRAQQEQERRADYGALI